MRSKQWLHDLPIVACCLIVFSIPWYFIYPTIGIWLLALSWIISGQFRGLGRRFLRVPIFSLWVLYFLLHAAGYFYCQDKAQSLFDTSTKLSFILFPILVGAGNYITLRGIATIILALVLGLMAAEGYCIFHAWKQWQLDRNISHFFYHELTKGLEVNAVYMAWYVIGALAGLLLFPWREAGYRWVLWLCWIPVIVLSAFLLLLASRLILLTYLMIVIPAFGIRLARRYRIGLLIPVLALGISVAGVYAIVRTHNPVHKRFADVMHPDMSTVFQEDYQGKEPKWSNLTLRLFVWRIAFENIRENNLWWHGTGNGDAYIYQNKRIAAHGIPNMEENSKDRSTLYKVNLHNMYLQSLLMLGIPGLLLLLILVFAPLFSLRHALAPWFFTVFNLISILFLVQESAFQTQAGVVYYCLFISLFWAGVKSNVKSEMAGEKTPDTER
jgi:O-antigen ligase